MSRKNVTAIVLWGLSAACVGTGLWFTYWPLAPVVLGVALYYEYLGLSDGPVGKNSRRGNDNVPRTG